MSRILDILDRLHGSRYFSTCDMKSGYYQILMDDNSIQKTAFSTQDQHWEYLRAPFGLRNMPQDFSRIVSHILGDLPYVQIYLDDFLINSKTFDEHMMHLEEVMKRMEEYNLKLNLQKCTFCADKVKILGHIVSFNKIEMDPAKTETIKSWAEPKNIKNIQQFIGLASYYRRHILDFSKHAAPLYNLLKKDIPFVWDKSCEIAFIKLKELLTSNPVLRPPDFNRDFYLFTDASAFGLGAILGQKDQDGNEFVISYASRLLKGAERNYSVTEKEALGVVWAVKYFRIYLVGKLFYIISDHRALLWLMNLKDPEGRLGRWQLLIQNLIWVLIYKEGRLHSNVDVLSRPVLNVELIYTIDLSAKDDFAFEKGLDVFENEPLLHYIKFGRHLAGASSNVIKRVLKNADFYRFDGKNILSRNIKDGVWKIVPEPSKRFDLVMSEHLIGHFMFTSTFNRIDRDYFWAKMKDQIAHVIKQCEPCARNEREKIFNHPARAIPISGIFDRVGCDLVFGLPESSEG